MVNGHNWNSIRLLTGCGKVVQKQQLVAIDMRFDVDKVLIILKKDSPKGPMVAFLETSNLDDALDVLARAIKAKAVPWKPDKYRSMRSDKK